MFAGAKAHVTRYFSRKGAKNAKAQREEEGFCIQSVRSCITLRFLTLLHSFFFPSFSLLFLGVLGIFAFA